MGLDKRVCPKCGDTLRAPFGLHASREEMQWHAQEVQQRVRYLYEQRIDTETRDKV